MMPSILADGITPAIAVLPGVEIDATRHREDYCQERLHVYITPAPRIIAIDA